MSNYSGHPSSQPNTYGAAGAPQGYGNSSPHDELSPAVRAAMDALALHLSGEVKLLGEQLRNTQSQIENAYRYLDGRVTNIEQRLQNIEAPLLKGLPTLGGMSPLLEGLGKRIDAINENVNALLEHVTAPSIQNPTPEPNRTEDIQTPDAPSKSNHDGTPVLTLSKFAEALDLLACETHGNARLLALRLTENLLALQSIARQIEKAQESDFNSEEWVSELDRLIFSFDWGVSWSAVTAEEVSESSRNALRDLRNAVENLAGLLKGCLRDQHGFSLIPVVPEQTIFDPDRHESSDFFTTPTSLKEQDNVLRGVQKNGFELRGRVLRRALVLRWLLQVDNADQEQSAIPSSPALESSQLHRDVIPESAAATEFSSVPVVTSEEHEPDVVIDDVMR